MLRKIFLMIDKRKTCPSSIFPDDVFGRCTKGRQWATIFPKKRKKQGKKFEKLIKIIDDSYLTNCYKSPKNYHIRRDVGAPIVRSLSSLKFGSYIFIKN